MYFKKFNQLYYEFNINGEQTVKAVRDITANVRVRKAILENITLFDEYDITDGDTPDIIAAKVYGSSEYHWVVMLCNQRYDYINDFPTEQNALNRYIEDKYGDAIDHVRHYKDDNGFIVMPNVIGAIPVTNREYEIEQNEAKRRIKLISPSLLAAIVSQFQGLI